MQLIIRLRFKFQVPKEDKQTEKGNKTSQNICGLKTA